MGRNPQRTAARPRRRVAPLLPLIAICAALSGDPSRFTAVSSAAQLTKGRVKALAVGKCLVASRELPDPNFSDSVVLLAEYGASGAMGVIVNRPTDLPIARVLKDMQGAQGRTDVVYFGGPVSTDALVALVRSAPELAGSRRVLNDVQLITTRESLEPLLSSGVKRDNLRTFLGYAGWGRGQLERETAAGYWHVVSGDADLVFDPEPEAVWLRLIRSTERLIALRLYPPASTVGQPRG
jgi:putative transcriptional regulator